MKITDLVYGNFEVLEPILIDLINSNSVQRLKDISQLGMPDEYSGVQGFSRYEHSVGVMCFLRKFGASLDEQLAGLLHDSSHTTFSHVIDWVIGDPTKEDYQDNIFEDFLKKSDASKILKKHNCDLFFISNLSNFLLLEREAPKLCADRLDYSLRQIHLNKKEKVVQEILNDLSVKNNQIVFSDLNLAEIFAKEYMNLQKFQWAGDQMRVRYYILSNILKEALKIKLISFEEFSKTETPLLKKLNNCNNSFIHSNLNLLRKGFTAVQDEKGVELKKKFRYIDPEISFNGSFKKLSEFSEEYKEFIEFEKNKKDDWRKVKIIPN